jgi:hypothetical protein
MNADQFSHVGLLAAKSQATNNTASPGVDLQQFQGKIAVHVDLGIKTAGDNDGTVTVQLQDSSTNNASNAANISGAATNTTNNTASFDKIYVDPRAQARYLFARVILTGTNSPAYPVSATIVGQKKYQS